MILYIASNIYYIIIVFVDNSVFFFTCLYCIFSRFICLQLFVLPLVFTCISFVFFSFYILSPVFIFTFILPSRERNWRTEKEPSLYRLNLFACQTRIIKWRQALLRSPKAFLLLCKTFFFFFPFFHKKAGKTIIIIFFVFTLYLKKTKQNQKTPPSLFSFPKLLDLFLYS